MKCQRMSVVAALWVCAVCLSCAPAARAGEAYLKEGDVILTTGDSITAQGVFQDHMQQVLDALYPEAGIKVTNVGSGGKSAGVGVGAVGGISAAPRKGRPTIVAVMFGVNDTGWSAGGIEAKAKVFVGHLANMIRLARERKVELIFLRETHFSHNAKPDAWVDSITKALEKLLEAQGKLAAEEGVPVIDVLGAYRAALKRAWAKDPLYEFTPDVIHPTQPGHAAMATEILRAMGAGLPLSTGKRAALRVERKAPVQLRAADATGIVAADGAIAVRLSVANASKEPVAGDVTVVVAGYSASAPAKVAPGVTQTLSLKIPAEKLSGRWGVVPLYMVFKGKGAFAAEHALFHYSRLHPVGKPLIVTGKDLGGTEKNPSTLSRAAVALTPAGAKIEFQWADKTPVYAEPKFKHRFGFMVNAPLDLGARAGQPCDAVEFLFDLRPDESTGRYTASTDANPKGVVRVGVYKVLENGKPVAKVLTPKGLPASKAVLTATGPDTYVLELKTPSKGSTVGVSMRLTDVEKYTPGGGAASRLTGRRDVVHEPMSYIRISPKAVGVFYRIGY